MAGDISRLVEDLGTALIDWARSSSSQAASYEVPSTTGSPDIRGIKVAPSTTLVFNELRPESDLALDNLSAMLEKISKMADTVYAYVDASEPKQEGEVPRKSEARKRFSALRNSATIRDTAQELSKMVVGEKLDDPPIREFELPSSGSVTPGPAIDNLPQREGDTCVRHGRLDCELCSEDDLGDEFTQPPADDPALREAHIFKMVKDIRALIPGQTGGPHETMDRLQAVLDYINPHQR